MIKECEDEIFLESVRTVVNNAPNGHVRIPPKPVMQDVTVVVLCTVIVDRLGVVVVVTTGPSGVR